MGNNNIPNSEHIVVVTEEKKRRKGLIWAAAGAACLMAGGSTFALWSANTDEMTGGTITAGDLNITATEEAKFWDVSADRSDMTELVDGTYIEDEGGTITGEQKPAHSIAIESWRVVPGDKLAASFPTEVTLEGDNLVAQVVLKGLAGMGAAGDQGDGSDAPFSDGSLRYTYEIYSDGELVVSESDLPAVDPETETANVLYLAAPQAGQDNGQRDTDKMLGDGVAIAGPAAQNTVFEMGDTTKDISLVVYAEFDDVDGRIDHNAKAALSNLTVSVEQVRDPEINALFVDTDNDGEDASGTGDQ